MRILVTGGLGFIGSNFIRHSISLYDKILNVDNMSYGSNPSNLKGFRGGSKYKFVKGSISNSKLMSVATRGIDAIVNFAAQSHVDRSISDPAPFIESNLIGAYTLLECARRRDIGTFVQVSTDEVYGDASSRGVDSFNESASTLPSSPYSATKAGAESLALAYGRTYGIKCVVTRSSNNFGPYQSPEKLIPKTVIRAMRNLKVPLYGGGLQTRSWIYVRDHVEALNTVIEKGGRGEIYNISAWGEMTNREIVSKILKLVGRPQSYIEPVDDRPGHDRKYSIDFTKITNELGWKPRYGFEESIYETVEWYQRNEAWWAPMATSRTLHPTPWKLKW